MPIRFYYDDVKFRLRQSKILKDFLLSKIELYKYSVGNILYIFVSDATLLVLNKEFLRHNYFTDIVTFDYNNSYTINGEIYISIDSVFNNALIYDVPFKRELLRVIFHGILHLVGFDDKKENEKVKMRAEEDIWIKEFIDINGRIDF